jgi:hypothetical protein
MFIQIGQFWQPLRAVLEDVVAFLHAKYLSERKMLTTKVVKKKETLLYVDPLLGNDPETNNYTTTVTRQRPVNSNRGTLSSMRFVSRCYRRSEVSQLSWVEWVGWWVSKWVRGLLRFTRCEMLLVDIGSWGTGQFGNPEEGERPSLDAATEQRLVKTWLWILVCVCVCVKVNCKVGSRAVQ